MLDRRLCSSAKIDPIEPRDRQRSQRRGELAWIRAAQTGHAEGIEAIFKLHWRPVYRAAYLIVQDADAAEDISQEAFLSAFRALDRFDRRRPLGPWLHRIVVNRAIDWSRARALRREVAESPELAQSQSHGAYPATDSHSEDLGAALASLTTEQRAVIVMRYLLDYRPGEIAKLLGLPRGTVNSRLRRGLDSLARSLKEKSS